MADTIPEAAEQCVLASSLSFRFLKLHRETCSVDSAKFGGLNSRWRARYLVMHLVAEQPYSPGRLEDRLTKKKITVGSRRSLGFYLFEAAL